MDTPRHNPAPYPTVESYICEICEEQPATTTAQLIDARLCQDCADTEPGTSGNYQ